MAKDNKKPVSIMDVDSSNLDEVLKNANTVDDEILKMAEEKISKEEKEEKADQLARMSKKAAYTNLKAHIEFKYTEECEDAYKDCMKKSKDLMEKLKKGELTPVAYGDELEKLIDDAIKAVDTAGKERRRRNKELTDKYTTYYSYNWDNPFNRLNRAIENNKR